LASLFIIPTGGLDATEANVREWIKASAAALGRDSKLITAQAVKDKDHDGIAKRVSECIESIKKAREK
jgi:2-dehydro-3-deoxyphosphogluconate aldolase / (4S)-4-hydroxy-2-oxoglutarate aldolase